MQQYVKRVPQIMDITFNQHLTTSFAYAKECQGSVPVATADCTTGSRLHASNGVVGMLHRVSMLLREPASFPKLVDRRSATELCSSMLPAAQSSLSARLVVCLAARVLQPACQLIMLVFSSLYLVMQDVAWLPPGKVLQSKWMGNQPA